MFILQQFVGTVASLGLTSTVGYYTDYYNYFIHAFAANISHLIPPQRSESPSAPVAGRSRAACALVVLLKLRGANVTCIIYTLFCSYAEGAALSCGAALVASCELLFKAAPAAFLLLLLLPLL